MCFSESQITVNGIAYFLNDKIKSSIAEFYNLNGAKITQSFDATTLSAQIHVVEEGNRKGVLVIEDPSSRQI